jgi:uncharacterized protein involved in outer membrane biogenesis
MMKKTLVGIVLVLGLAIAGLLVAPSFVDWNAHTGRVAAEVEKLTGRKVVIDGPVSVRLIPRPMLSVEGVRLANIEGARHPNMVSLDRLEVRVVAAPLLAGRLQVEAVELVRPVISLERLADGRVNWALDAKQEKQERSRPATEATSSSDGVGGAPVGGLGSAIAIDNFVLIDGRVLYHDAVRGREEKIENLDARVSAVSLAGPIESSGALSVRGKRLSYAINIAEIIRSRTVPLTAELNLGDGTVFRIDGSVTNISEKPKLRAKVAGSGPSLGQSLRSFAKIETPSNLSRPFSVEGTVEADVDAAKVEETVVQVGDTQVALAMNAAYSESVGISVSARSGWVNLDEWLVSPKQKGDGDEKQSASTGAPASSTVSGPNARSEADRSKKPLSLPKDIQAAVTLKIDSLVFKGKPIQGLALNAELANGELALSQLTAQLPGKADVAVFGFATTKNGKVQFDGEVEARTEQLSVLAEWLVPGMTIPNKNFENLTLKTPVVVDPNYAQLSDLKVTAGASKIRGAVTIALQKRLSLGANIKVDKLNLEKILATDKPVEKTRNDINAQKPVAAAAPQAPAGKKNSAPMDPAAVLAPLKLLNTFDANVNFGIDALTLPDQTAKNLRLDASLAAGRLKLKNLSVDDFAGLRASIAGGLGNLDGLPRAENLRVLAKSKSVSRFAKALGITLPLPAKSIGNLTIDAVLDGTLVAPNVDLTAGVFGGDMSLRGKLSPLLLVGKEMKFVAALKHPNMAGLLKRLGVDYQPQGKIGGVDVSATVSGTQKTIKIADLAGALGKISLSGALTAQLAGVKPDIRGDLAIGAITIDPFLPAKRRAQIWPDPWRISRLPAVWIKKTRVDNPLWKSTALSRRWDSEAFDLGILEAMTGQISLTSPRVRFQDIVIDKLDTALALSAGVLEFSRLTGSMFGGQVSATARLTKAGELAAGGKANEINLAKASAVIGSKAAGKINGDFNLRARGHSEAEIISSLSGTFAVIGKNLDAGFLSNPETGFGLGGLVLALNQLGGALGGPKRGSGVADLEAAFDLQNGIARPRTLQAVTNVGIASGQGTIDLPAWQLDLQGSIKPSTSILSTLLNVTTKKGINVPFSVTGDISKPRIKVNTASLGTGGIPIPGLDKVLKKKGLGNVLQGILGGGTSSPSTGAATSSGGPPSQSGSTTSEPPSQAPTQPQPSPQKLKAQDILRGILGGLGR